MWSGSPQPTYSGLILFQNGPLQYTNVTGDIVNEPRALYNGDKDLNFCEVSNPGP